MVVRQLKLPDGRIIPANKFLDNDSDDKLELNEEEKIIEQNIKVCIQEITRSVLK